MKKGFTFVELMIASAILSLGTILIYESFFKSLDLYAYCNNYFNVVSWLDEKLWQAQDDIIRTGILPEEAPSGSFVKNNRNFGWELSYSPLEGPEGLYKVSLSLFWKEGNRNVAISRSAFARYDKEKK